MLAAALELFAEKGYHNVSMHEIAAKAEFAIGTLYKFFQNKEELYKTLVLEQCDRFDEAFSQVLDTQEDEVTKLRRYVLTKGERFRGNLAFVRLFLAESRGASFNFKAGLDDEVRGRYTLFLGKLASIFDSGFRSGRFRKVAPPFQMAVAFDSVLNAFLLLWLDAPEQYPFPEDPDIILKIFFDGLLNP